MQVNPSVEARADHGLVGDRYANKCGSKSKPDQHPDRQLTFIAQEQLDWLHIEHGIALTGSQSRRNVLTQGIDLNALVGKRFLVGNVEVEGMRLSQPCKPLSEVLGFDFVTLMRDRSGLNCRILSSGTISVGDTVTAD